MLKLCVVFAWRFVSNESVGVYIWFIWGCVYMKCTKLESGKVIGIIIIVNPLFI